MLFRIDPRPFVAAVTEVKARLTGARSQATLAPTKYSPARNLLQYRAASEANLEQRIQAVENTKAQVVQAEAALQRARLDLKFATIRAPLAGRIGPAPGQPRQPGLGWGGELGNAAGHHRHHGPDRFHLRSRPGLGASLRAARPAGRPALLARLREPGATCLGRRNRLPAPGPRRLRRQQGGFRHRHDPPARPLRQPARHFRTRTASPASG